MKGLRTWIEIDIKALRHNIGVFFRLIPRNTKLMAMIKSNAYGHGLVFAAKAVSGFPEFRKRGWFGADSIVEALCLRREGIKNPILVLGYTLSARVEDAAKNNITLTVSHFEALRQLARARRRPAFHLKVDTGMHRQGFQEHEIPKLIKKLKINNLVPAGVYSHLASAGNKAFSGKQVDVFLRIVQLLRSDGIHIGMLHFNKTGGIVYYPEMDFDVVRLGIGLYGYFPYGDLIFRGKKINLRPVLTWKTIVGEAKEIKKGEYISYDLTERMKKNSKIAILPIGYWHGYDRGLSSVGRVLIRGKYARVLGRVTMDMVTVDVSNIQGVRVGDEVVLIGNQGTKAITADEVGQRIGTTSYEVITRLNPLIRRIKK